jgi:polyhydroxybutyrate depolymerase
MKTRKWMPVILILLCSMWACRAAGSNSTAGPVTRTLVHEDAQRSYILHIPASVDQTQPAALVVALHGGTGNAQIMIDSSEFNQVADDNGFIVAYPNGAGQLDDKLLTWNGGTCCGYAQRNNVDDTGFIRAMVADIQTIAAVDPKRIYAAGMSNGAIMSYRLACEAADLFAAIAPVAGTLNFSPCNPAETVSVIGFHGTADQHIPYQGGFGPESLVEVDFASVQDSVNFWVSFNGCNPQAQKDVVDEIEHETWSGCRDGSAVELYTIVDGGHAWPGGNPGWAGGDPPTQVLSASQAIWEFFAAHPKP